MKYQLKHNLGLEDATRINKDFGATLSLKPSDLAAGQTVELSASAAEWLTSKKGYVALLTPANAVKGEAKKPEITAPAK